MMTWELSDGTKVTLDGDVEGDSGLARQLRKDTDRAKSGGFIWVPIGPPPGGLIRLELGAEDNAHVFDLWVRREAHMAGVTVLSGPEVHHVPEEPSELPADTIF